MAWKCERAEKFSRKIDYTANETKSNINKLIEDILILQFLHMSKNLLDKSFSSPLKEARKYFEKEYLTTQLKKSRKHFKNS